MQLKPVHWVVLLILAALWGSSYLMVEIALAVWQPAEITGLRVLLAGVVLLLAVVFGRRHLPAGLQAWAYFLAIAVIGNCMPYFLISWGQKEVESGLAGILAGTTPLVVLVVAHFALHDEKLSIRQVIAFVLGFTGILVLMGPDSLAAIGGSALRLWSQLAVLAGSVCYALATVIARRMPAYNPIVTSAGVMLIASAMMSPFIVQAAANFSDISWQAAGAIGFLGLLGTGLASILYFYLVAATSARFTSFLNYLVPLWAVSLGALVLGETLPLSSWAALLLIMGGLIFSQRGALNENAA